MNRKPNKAHTDNEPYLFGNTGRNKPVEKKYSYDFEIVDIDTSIITIYDTTPFAKLSYGDYILLNTTVIKASTHRYKEEIIIPEGFVTNFASMPQILKDIGLGYDLRKAALVHDYLYAESRIPRKAADKIFYDILITCGVPYCKAILAYTAVRTFGASHYEGSKP